MAWPVRWPIPRLLSSRAATAKMLFAHLKRILRLGQRTELSSSARWQPSRRTCAVASVGIKPSQLALRPEREAKSGRTGVRRETRPQFLADFCNKIVTEQLRNRLRYRMAPAKKGHEQRSELGMQRENTSHRFR